MRRFSRLRTTAPPSAFFTLMPKRLVEAAASLVEAAVLGQALESQEGKLDWNQVV